MGRALRMLAPLNEWANSGSVVVGAYLWAMLLLFRSIVLETFMVYPNIFHNPPASLTTALSS